MSRWFRYKAVKSGHLVFQKAELDAEYRLSLYSLKKVNKAEEKKKRKEGRTGHLSQFGVVNEVGSVSVDEGTQSQAVLPT